MKRTLKELQELWDKLGDIPVNNDDEIEEDFLNFPAGTSKFDVWHWFDERCPNGVAEARKLWRAVSAMHRGAEFRHGLVEDITGHQWSLNRYENDFL